ncbi:MAG: FAD-dependent oxidoreductase, partial [Pseudomonadota bacterium]
MAEIETDILVAGGGIAGLTVAARLAAEGFRVVAVDPRPTGQMPEDEGADRRTTAFLMPAVETFRRAGAWPRLVAEATALNGMRIVSAAGGTGLGPRGTSRAQGPKPRAEALFDAGELGDAPFGYNVVNTAARTALAAALAERAHARAIEGRRVMAARRRLSGAMAELDDGTWIAARLIVAADGRDSP